MKFSQIPYQRPKMNEISDAWQIAMEKLNQAKSVEDAYYALLSLDGQQRYFESMAVISEIRHTMDTNDDFYKQEEVFFERAKVEFEGLIQERNQMILKSLYVDEIREYLSPAVVDRLKKNAEAFDPCIQNLLEEENALSGKYFPMTANITGQLAGKTYSIAELGKLAGNDDRETRRIFSGVMEAAYEKKSKEFDCLFHDLVQVRQQIASKLGFDNFVAVGYGRMGRTSYTPEDMAVFRREVEEILTPVVYDLFKAQEKRLGLQSLMNFDENTDFLTGNPSPKAGIPVLLDTFQSFFSNLSPSTKDFYQELRDKEFYDLGIRKGKIMGAYSNFVPLFHAPFVFETYNETAGAVKTFAHECGHAYQSYLVSKEVFVENTKNSSDLAEIHSMTMEFFSWEGMEALFGETGVKKYQYFHLKRALSFIPYGTAVDAFQHEIYENPDWTPAERLSAWKALEEKFLPWRRYTKDGFYDQGRFWQRQVHIYKWPFYYIDYVLAQVCALQFFLWSLKDQAGAFQAYEKLLEISGRRSFTEALEEVGLKSPFIPGSMKKVANEIQEMILALEESL
ncbi:M3 family oligoendopeptidase [Gottschalkiaceae bacterium SANA]|nr:M3 family oligoendopeptidase [Gottschalkiaceae bacterium SANA]